MTNNKTLLWHKTAAAQHTQQFGGLCPSAQISASAVHHFWWNHQYFSASVTINNQSTVQSIIDQK